MVKLKGQNTKILGRVKEKQLLVFKEKDNTILKLSLEEIDKYWAMRLQNQMKKVWIVFMGPEPTSRPNDFIWNDKMVVIRGEPEYSLAEFLREEGGDYLVFGSITKIGNFFSKAFCFNYHLFCFFSLFL